MYEVTEMDTHTYMSGVDWIGQSNMSDVTEMDTNTYMSGVDRIGQSNMSDVTENANQMDLKSLNRTCLKRPGRGPSNMSAVDWIGQSNMSAVDWIIGQSNMSDVTEKAKSNGSEVTD